MRQKKYLNLFSSMILALALWSFTTGGYAADSDADEEKENQKAARALATKLCDDIEALVEAHCEQTASDCEEKTLYVNEAEDCPINVLLAEPHIFDGEPVAVARQNQKVEVLGCKCGKAGNYLLVKAPNFCGFMRADALRSEQHPPYKKSKEPKSAAGVEACNVGAVKG
jgi:hypothetical protein